MNINHASSRRDFLRETAIAATGMGLAASIPSVSAAAADDPIPIIDTHQHLWDLAKLRLPWTKDVAKLAKNYVMSDYLDATKGLNVVKAVYMEVDVDPVQQVEEAEHLIEICRRGDSPTRAAVISGRPASSEFKEYITRFKGSRYIKGIRQVLHVETAPAGFCTTKEFVRGVKQLGELGMSFDLCMRGDELADAAKLIDACPDTRFILDHCGNGNVQAKDRSKWQKGLSEVAARKNVVCKISGIIASAKPGEWKPADLEPIINYTIKQFGIDRVMFGGDWPVCTLTAAYREWVEALREILSRMKMSTADQRKLFHDNAAKFYGLASS